MASYGGGVTILPTQKPFDIMQNPLINAYAKAALKNKFDQKEAALKEKKQQANYDKFKSFAKASGKSIEEGYTNKGPYFKTVEEKDPTLADLQVGAAGALPKNKYAQIGRNMGIQPEMLPADQNPAAAMSMADGSIGDAQEDPVAPVQQDYSKTVMNALRTNPMVNRPGRQATQLPVGFAEDFKSAHDSAAGDADKFVSSLKDIGLKYADNPTALSQVQRLISMNKPSKKGRPSRQ